MGNSRKACTYAVGMLGVLAFYGLGCKSPEPPIVQVDPAVKNAEKALKEKVDNDPALKDIRPDVPVVLDALNQKCQIDTQFCKSILPFVGDIARSTSVGSSPLKVRGGAMTVFAENNEGWQGDGSTNPWCVSLDSTDTSQLSYIAVDKLVDTAGITVTVPIDNVTPPWTIKIYGHVPKPIIAPTGSPRRGDPSQNGIQLASNTQDCLGNPGTSVRLTAFGPTGSIYPIDLPVKAGGKRKGNKRFWDTSCVGPPDTTGKGDQDFCERMAKVEISFSGVTSPQTFTCHDGDCGIEVGKSQ